MERLTQCRAYDYQSYKKLLDKICDRYPFLGIRVIGKSVMGRDIHVLSLGNSKQTKECVLFAAAFHGSEHITRNISLMFLEDLCYALNKNTSLAGINMRKGLLGRAVMIVPLVNPDGCEISISGEEGAGDKKSFIRKIAKGDYEHFNANIRGVDINHNFNADWENLKRRERKSGIFEPSCGRFGGTLPESEPETVALCELCRSTSLRHVLALHSQGEVIYWNYKDKRPKNSEQMAQILANVSGYALDVPMGTAVGGGFKDWFISEFDRPGFTVEVGRGKNPLPIEAAEGIYKGISEMLCIAAIM